MVVPSSDGVSSAASCTVCWRPRKTAQCHPDQRSRYRPSTRTSTCNSGDHLRRAPTCPSAHISLVPSCPAEHHCPVSATAVTARPNPKGFLREGKPIEAAREGASSTFPTPTPARLRGIAQAARKRVRGTSPSERRRRPADRALGSNAGVPTFAARTNAILRGDGRMPGRRRRHESVAIASTGRARLGIRRGRRVDHEALAPRGRRAARSTTVADDAHRAAPGSFDSALEPALPDGAHSLAWASLSDAPQPTFEGCSSTLILRGLTRGLPP